MKNTNSTTNTQTAAVANAPKSNPTAKKNDKTVNGEKSMQLHKALESMSVEELRQQLEAKTENEITALKERLQKLNDEVANVEKQIAVLQGPKARKGGGKRGPRVKNDKPLAHVIHEILTESGEALTTRQIEEKLAAKDYKSDAKNVYTIIFMALTKHPELFRKAGRGQYEAING